MKKFIRILLLILTTIIIFIAASNYFAKRSFLKSLKGEIVYVKRDGDILNVYKILANGKNKQLLYRHTGEQNLNCSNPRWSRDGSKISFIAMKNGKWGSFIMNSDGGNVKATKDKGDEPPVSLVSRENDIIVRNGSVYYLNEKGNEMKVHKFMGYIPKFNEGASEASWSPDKKFIIFDSSEGTFLFVGHQGIFIASKDGKVVKIIDGMQPDWKY